MLLLESSRQSEIARVLLELQGLLQVQLVVSADKKTFCEVWKTTLIVLLQIPCIFFHCKWLQMLLVSILLLEVHSINLSI